MLEAPGGAAEGSFAVLHGLYWAVLNLAEERPVLLALDDLQWSDRPSLRFVTYLVRRLEGAPVLVAATLRSTEPGTDPALIAEVAADPLCEAVRPGPLGAGAVTELVTARLGDPEPRFAAACREATGGNPLLLRHLLAALEQDGVAPRSAGAAAVREIGTRAVSRAVLLRISRLPAEAVAVARSVAVLGDSSGLPAVAALTGLDETTVARAAGELARADILRAETPLGYVHPLVRDVVYLDVPAGERELQHGRAAEVLAGAGAPAEEVAAQLLHAPRRGDGATVELLRGAAGQAAQRGAPDSAIAYLERALEEPPAAGLRGKLHFELGVASAEMNAPAAAEHLRVAYDALTDREERATAAFALAQSLLFTGHAAEGGALARHAAAEAPPDARMAIEAMELIAVFFGHDPEAHRRIGHSGGSRHRRADADRRAGLRGGGRRAPGRRVRDAGARVVGGRRAARERQRAVLVGRAGGADAGRKLARAALAHDHARAGAPQRVGVLDLVGRAVDGPVPARDGRPRGGARLARAGEPAAGAVGVGADRDVLGARPARLSPDADRRRRRRAGHARLGAGRRRGVGRSQPVAPHARRAAAGRRAGGRGARRRRADGRERRATCCTRTGSRGSR